MLGTKYLSELVTPDMLVRDKLNIIKAPTGSGKTFFALTTIPGMLKDAVHKVIFLIDTINGREQILKNYNARPIYRNWANEVCEEAMYFETDNNIVIITYAKFGSMLERTPDFHKHFEYIICDELPSLLQFMHFAPKPNVHSIAKNGLERAVQNGRSIVIALSATPNRVKNGFHAPCHDVLIDDNELIRYETRRVVPYMSLEYLFSSLDANKTGLCYVSRISSMIALEEDARKLGMKPISIWSIYNRDYPMTDEQLRVRQSILNDFVIPKEYNLVFINASSETSLKIKSHVDYVIVHDGDEDTQVQVRGRVNSDLDCLYLPCKAPVELVVPTEFLNRKLFTADKDTLCDCLNLRNESGRQFRWRGVKSRLIERGYTITEDREHSCRYAVITEPKE